MTAPAPRVTIMIPTYGQAPFLPRAIESALAQDYPALDVVVADDASPDDTGTVVARYLGDARLRYVRNPRNLGRVGNYRSTLEHHARGIFVLNMDGDDWLVDHRYLSRAMELVERDPSLDLVFARAQSFLEERQAFAEAGTVNRGLPEICDGTELFLAYPDGSVSIPHITALYRRALALELDFYREDVLGSDSIALLSLLPGRRVGFVDMHAGAWRKHDANATFAPSLAAQLANLAVADVPAARAGARGALPLPVLRRWRRRMAMRVGRKSVQDSLGLGRPGTAAAYLGVLAVTRPAVAAGIVSALARKVARRTRGRARTAPP